MTLAGKTALVASGATMAAVAAMLRGAGARVETEATLEAAAARFGGIDIVFTADADTIHAALPYLRENGTVIHYGRAAAHPPAALLAPRRIRVNHVVADAFTPAAVVAEAVLHLASDAAFTAQGEEIVLDSLALAS